MAAAASSVLAFGNPGSGKCSLLNVLMARPQFEAGLSMGEGRTKRILRADLDGVAYYDVPGLSDCSFRTQAAAAITEALKQGGGACKVVFVVTLENGRVKPDDAVTIRAVLLAAPTISGYGVVVNNLPPPVVRRLEDPEDGKKITDALMEIIPPTRRTTAFFFQPRIDDMDGEEHHRIDYAARRESDFQELVKFVGREVRPCHIRPEEVTPVDPASFAQMQQQYAALKKEAAELAEKLAKEAAARKLADQKVSKPS